MKKILLTLVMVLLATSLVHPSDIPFDENTPFDKNAPYDIVYKIDLGKLEKVRNVKITGIVEIGNVSFLVIEAIGGKKGYIKMSNVKSILNSMGGFQTNRERQGNP